MLICGVKASHDGGVALIADGALLASIEVEKLNNGRRWSPLGQLDAVAAIIGAAGYDPAAVDRFVIDGWITEPEATSPSVRMASDTGHYYLPVAPYVDDACTAPLARYEFAPVGFGHDVAGGYSSYHHASNHILGSYCTSPFAERGQDAMVVLWDGAIVPRAYHVTVTGQPSVHSLVRSCRSTAASSHVSAAISALSNGLSLVSGPRRPRDVTLR